MVGVTHLLIIRLIIIITDTNETVMKELKVKTSLEKLRGSARKGWRWPPYP